MNEPEPYGEPGDFRPKIIINQNCQIVKKVSEICKHFAENHSTNYVCYTNKMQDGDINTFITDTSKKKWIIVTDDILNQGMEAASVSPKHDLNISKNLISRAVVELVLILAYRTEETNIGTEFRLSSFKSIGDLVALPFLHVIKDFIPDEHLNEEEHREMKEWIKRKKEGKIGTGVVTNRLELQYMEMFDRFRDYHGLDSIGYNSPMQKMSSTVFNNN